VRERGSERARERERENARAKERESARKRAREEGEEGETPREGGTEGERCRNGAKEWGEIWGWGRDRGGREERRGGDCAHKQPMLQWCSDACLWAISARCPQAESGCQIIRGTLFDILGSRKCCLVLLVQTLVCNQMGYRVPMVARCVRAPTSDNQTTTRRNKNTVAHNVDCPARCQLHDPGSMLHSGEHPTLAHPPTHTHFHTPHRARIRQRKRRQLWTAGAGRSLACECLHTLSPHAHVCAYVCMCVCMCDQCVCMCVHVCACVCM